MFKLNMKSMLLMSKSSEKTIHTQKRFKLGKSAYTVLFDLDGENLIIRNVKRTNCSNKLKNRLRKRRKRIAHSIKFHRFVVPIREFRDNSTQTTQQIQPCAIPLTATYTVMPHKRVDRGTLTCASDMKYISSALNEQCLSTCNQTTFKNVSTTTEDLKILVHREQQTLIKHYCVLAMQTDAVQTDTCGVQVEKLTLSFGVQSDNSFSTIGNQTECYSQPFGVQTDWHSYAELDEDTPVKMLHNITHTLNTQNIVLCHNTGLTMQLMDLHSLRKHTARMHCSTQTVQRAKSQQVNPDAIRKATPSKMCLDYYKLPWINTAKGKTHCVHHVPQKSSTSLVYKITQTDLKTSESSTQTNKKKGCFYWRSFN